MPEQPELKIPPSTSTKHRHFWLIILLIISLMLVGYLIYMIFFYTSYQPFINQVNTNQNMNNQANANQNVNSESNCSQLEAQIQALIDQENHCQQDSDCVVGEGFFCPFGCYNLFNKDNKEVDLNQIIAEVKEYNNICPTCVYKCMIPPTAAEIKCVAGKCTDTRFTD